MRSTIKRCLPSLNACTIIGVTISKALDNKFKFLRITRISSGLQKRKFTIVAKHAGLKSFLDLISRLHFVREFVKENQMRYLDGLITAHLKGGIRTPKNMNSRFSSLIKSKISRIHTLSRRWK